MGLLLQARPVLPLLLVGGLGLAKGGQTAFFVIIQPKSTKHYLSFEYSSHFINFS
jgi:hypothetical protein